MVVCSCAAVNDRRIVAEIVDGALDPDAVADRCGAGAHCGECRPTIEALLVKLGLAGQPAA
ncbi:MAG TPA: (2Fe-2S)-binding protein [Acidimicrobiales bacterium]|nr:(2Fe-2S)-binding protein [Acidimicrobiales bacterium]